MSLRDPFGQFPAPISTPEAWPPNYADGFNQAVHLMTEAFPSVLAALAGGGEPVTDEMVERAWMAHTGLDKLGPAYAQDYICMLPEEREQMRRAAFLAARG